MTSSPVESDHSLSLAHTSTTTAAARTRVGCNLSSLPPEETICRRREMSYIKTRNGGAAVWSSRGRGRRGEMEGRVFVSTTPDQWCL